MVHHLIVLGVGVAIGLSIVAIVSLLETERTPNRPHSQRRDPYSSRRTYPSPPPSPKTRRPTNIEQRSRATNTEPRSRANRPPSKDRATSPINNARHFPEYCSSCNDRETVAFQPCGDYAMCLPCAEQYLSSGGRNCPYCHRRIQSVV